MKVAVIGVGNLLLGDEGVGIHTVRRLATACLPSGVEVIDGGTGGLNLLDYMDGRDLVVFIDCADAGGPPGTIYRLSLDDLEGSDAETRLFSLHEVGLAQTLALAKRLLTRLPTITIYGVQPARVAWDTNLSPELAQVLPKLVELVKEEIVRWLEGRQHSRREPTP